jgi:hypothetical protein
MSQVKKLTRLGSDTRKIAALLQAKAPKGEMLAYINPQEAALLRAYGGSGKPHADTGIPSYQVESDFSEGYMADMTPYQGPDISNIGYDPSAMALGLGYGEAGQGPTMDQISGGVPPISAPSTISSGFPDYTGAPVVPGGGSPVEFTGTAPPTYAAPQTYQDVFGAQPSATGGFGDSLKKLSGALGLDKADPLKLGLAGIQGLIGARGARQAAAQGRAGKQEMQALAAPYRQQGQQLQAQAARGELTPQAQQSLQAVQAQVAQGVQNRGGVGAAQAAAQVEAVRQQLLQSQSDYGLKLSGIGDQIALGAIRAGIQADQYVNQLTSSYMNNIMRMFGGVAPTQQPTGARP